LVVQGRIPNMGLHLVGLAYRALRLHGHLTPSRRTIRLPPSRRQLRAGVRVAGGPSVLLNGEREVGVASNPGHEWPAGRPPNEIHQRPQGPFCQAWLDGPRSWRGVLHEASRTLRKVPSALPAAP
jgi:hypothetical protein